RRPHQVAVGDENTVGDDLLDGAQHERGLAVAARCHEHHVLTVAHVADELGELTLAVCEGRVEGEGAEGKGIYDHIPGCIRQKCISRWGAPVRSLYTRKHNIAQYREIAGSMDKIRLWTRDSSPRSARSSSSTASRRRRSGSVSRNPPCRCRSGRSRSASAA